MKSRKKRTFFCEKEERVEKTQVQVKISQDHVEGHG